MGVWDGLDESEISRPEILSQSAPGQEYSNSDCSLFIGFQNVNLLIIFVPLFANNAHTVFVNYILYNSLELYNSLMIYS